MGEMKILSLVAALPLLIAAAPAEQGANKPISFLKDLGNSTWILGNGIWNVTQKRQYANQLYYKGEDRVGKAVGHYVSYSRFAITKNRVRIEPGMTDVSNRWGCI